VLHINAIGKQPKLAVANKVVVYMSGGKVHSGKQNLVNVEFGDCVFAFNDIT